MKRRDLENSFFKRDLFQNGCVGFQRGVETPKETRHYGKLMVKLLLQSNMTSQLLQLILTWNGSTPNFNSNTILVYTMVWRFLEYC